MKISTILFTSFLLLSSPSIAQECFTPTDLELDIKEELKGTGIGVELYYINERDIINNLVKALVPKNKEVDAIEFFKTSRVPTRNVLVAFYSNNCLQETTVLDDDVYQRLRDSIMNARKDRASNGA